jgi:hypothetical protein
MQNEPHAKVAKVATKEGVRRFLQRPLTPTIGCALLVTCNSQFLGFFGALCVRPSCLNPIRGRGECGRL